MLAQNLQASETEAEEQVHLSAGQRPKESVQTKEKDGFTRRRLEFGNGPDLNPTEHLWGDLRTRHRHVAASEPFSEDSVKMSAALSESDPKTLKVLQQTIIINVCTYLKCQYYSFLIFNFPPKMFPFVSPLSLTGETSQKTSNLAFQHGVYPPNVLNSPAKRGETLSDASFPVAGLWTVRYKYQVFYVSAHIRPRTEDLCLLSKDETLSSVWKRHLSLTVKA